MNLLEEYTQRTRYYIRRLGDHCGICGSAQLYRMTSLHWFNPFFASGISCSVVITPGFCLTAVLFTILSLQVLILTSLSLRCTDLHVICSRMKTSGFIHLFYCSFHKRPRVYNHLSKCYSGISKLVSGITMTLADLCVIDPTRAILMTTAVF